MTKAMESLDNMKVAAIQMVSSTNVSENLDKAAKLIDFAADQGAKLVLLPEYFCLMGSQDTDKLKIKEEFNPSPLDESLGNSDLNQQLVPESNENNAQLQHFLANQALKHNIWLIGGTIPIKSPQPDKIYNTCLVYDPNGKLQARYDKIHLFGFDNGQEKFAEADTIMPGEACAQVFESPIGGVGLSICYDLRFPELYRAMPGVNLIVVPSAFTFTTGRAHWETLLKARAIENQCYVLAAAQGGKHESGRRTWGQSILIDPWGKVIDELATGSGVVIGEISMHTLNKVRKSLPALNHRVL